jgi:hypothetical protein
VKTAISAAASRLSQAWIQFWFQRATPDDLGFCRLQFFALLFAVYVHEDFSGWGSVSPVFWMPIWVFEKTGLPVLGSGALEAVQLCWKVSLVTSAIGLLTRGSMIVSFALGSYLLGLPHNFGQTYHFDALLVFVLGALTLSRAGDAWSLDALIRASRSPAAAVPHPSGEYTWPIRIVWVLMALVFFGAGLSKLRHGGVDWVMSDTMRTFLIRAHYGVSDADPLVGWGLLLAQWPWGPRLLAAVSMATELLFPLTLVSVRARRILVPAAFGMLVGIRMLMGPTFGGFLVANVFWVPWTALAERAPAWRKAARLLLRGRRIVWAGTGRFPEPPAA